MSFSEVYRRLQQTAVRRSGIFNENARRSAHIARRSTIPARELFANDWEGAVVTYFSPRSNPLEISCLSFEAISSFWIESRTGEDVGQQLSADVINKCSSCLCFQMCSWSLCSSGSTVNVCAIDVSKAFYKMNHYGLLIKLMKRHIPENLLLLLENWLAIGMTCVKWHNVWSRWFRLSCGIRPEVY